MSLSRTERIKEWFKAHIRLPRGIVIAICVLPAFLTGLYYLFRSNTGVMDWVLHYVSQPVRNFFGLLSSIYPFSIMEIVCTVLGVFLIYYIIKSIRDTSRRREKWKLLGKRLLPILVAACYIWCMFCWFWNSGYHGTGFAAKNGFEGGGVAAADLIAVTEMFAEMANELSILVERDADGRYVSNQRDMFEQSVTVYRNISNEFPGLSGRLYPPKAMLYSWFMSIAGYTGLYFALTGEVMINSHPPGAFMPSTVAHEHAHHLGIFAEDEAEFIGILACVKSENTVFEYAGYMNGLNRLLNALAAEDADAWHRIVNGLTEEVNNDRQELFEFWAAQKISNTGFRFWDNFLTAVKETTNDAVNTIYDNYLRSQNQELGVKSYGACVDLLVEYFCRP